MEDSVHSFLTYGLRALFYGARFNFIVRKVLPFGQDRNSVSVWLVPNAPLSSGVCYEIIVTFPVV